MAHRKDAADAARSLADRPGRDIADALVLVSVRLTRTLQALGRSGDLSGPEISALAVIVYSDGVTARDLAALEQVTPATISRLIAGLEEKALVRRDADAHDARLQWIKATAMGARRIREGHERRIAPLARVVAALPREKRQKLEEAAAILDEVIAEVQAGAK